MISLKLVLLKVILKDNFFAFFLILFSKTLKFIKIWVISIFKGLKFKRNMNVRGIKMKLLLKLVTILVLVLSSAVNIIICDNDTDSSR